MGLSSGVGSASSGDSGEARRSTPAPDGTAGTTVVVTAQDGTTTSTYTVAVTRATAMDATLSALVLSDGTDEVALTPAFDSATQTYTATVPNSVASVTATPTVTEPNATVTVNGAAVVSGSPSDATELEIGENVITVVVTAQDGTTTSTYTVAVTRATAMDATLSALVLSDGTDEVALTPAFDSATQTYTATVPNSVASVTVTPSVTEPNATVTVNGAAVASGSPSDATELEIGENVITVVVTAQDGTTTSTYTVAVTRATAMDATLSALVLSDGTDEVALTPAFDSATQTYTATVPNSVASVTVTPSVTEPNATVTVNGAAVASGSPSDATELEIGENVITVVVTAQDGTTTSTYTVAVTRATAMDATLSALVLSDGTDEVALTPAFDSATQTYTATVPNSVASVTVTPSVTEPNATVTVNGAAVASGSPSDAIELEIGENVITVVVTAQDGTTTSTYTVAVTKATPVPALPFGGAALLGILLVFLGGRRYWDLGKILRA